MKATRLDGRRCARQWPTGSGARAKLSYDDMKQVRELYAIGRVDVPKPLTAAEIAAKFGVSHMTIRRIVAMHELELEARRKAQQCDSSASSSASTSARSS